MKKFLAIIGVLAVCLFVGVAAMAILATGADRNNLSSPQATPTSILIKDKADTGPKLTAPQKNAKRAAQTYLSLSGWSKAGLIRQLHLFDKFSTADATVAVNTLKVDYNKEAVESAEAYLDFTGYSRDGLIRQMTQYDHYTTAQASYAADEVGL